jgi:hypothetical protein
MISSRMIHLSAFRLINIGLGVVGGNAPLEFAFYEPCPSGLAWGEMRRKNSKSHVQSTMGHPRFLFPKRIGAVVDHASGVEAQA